MNLIDGLILHTIGQANQHSKHSLLMRFYQLEKDIEIRYNEVEKPFHDLPLYLMRIEAFTILKTLNIL